MANNNNNLFVISFCALLLLCCCVSVFAALPVITVKHSKLFVNGVEFIVKGVNYSPAPIGQSGTASSGYGGTGYCSPKLTPWGEWKSACYDSDYFDGSSDVDPTRFPNGFKPLWERDFPYIKAIGANTVRLYNTNPSTRAATQVYKNLFTHPTGKDHTQFMKYCEDNGLFVIYPLFSDDYAYWNTDEVTFKRYLRWQIDEVGNSSALLIWQFGNEIAWEWCNKSPSTCTNAAYTNKWNRYMDYIRKYTLAKWGRFIPVTSAIPNIPANYNYQYANWHVDIFSANIFGLDFTNLFSGNTNPAHNGITKLQCMYSKPFLMTEVGPTAAKGQVYNKGALNQIWSQVVKYIPNGLIGGVWFEQTDEPHLNKDFGLFGLAVNTVGSASSNQVDVWHTDSLVFKQQYYDALNGTYNGVKYNFKENIFTLLKRSATSLSSSRDICSSTTYKACPGGTTPPCNGNGVCDRVAGRCTCANGWTGSSCSTAVCPGGSNPCSRRGVCSTFTDPPECVCNYGYYNGTCELSVSNVAVGSCPGGCRGNGVCSNQYGSYACDCYPGWTGPDCAVTDVGKGSINIQQHYLGCFSVSTSSNFAVVGPVSTAQTNQKCRYYCALRGYAFTATGGNTCYCDTTKKPTSTSTCSTTCSGDSLQKCGGSSRNSVYNSGSLAQVGYKGCYSDNATRDLPNLVYSGTSNTVDSCRKACKNAGYLYAGTQAGNECWCGNTFGVIGTKLADSQCSTACPADATVKCGAGWANSIYTSDLPVGYAYY